MHFHFIIPKCKLFFIIHSKTLLRYKLKWKIGRVKCQINRNTLSQNHCVTNFEIEIFVSKILNFSLSLSLFIPLVFLLRKKNRIETRLRIKLRFRIFLPLILLLIFYSKCLAQKNNGVMQKNCTFSLFFFLSMYVCGFLFNFFSQALHLYTKNFFYLNLVYLT